MPESGILGDAERRGEIGRGVEARRRDRHRQELEPAVRLAQIVALDDDLLAARRVGPHRRDRMRDRLDPGAADLLDRRAACRANRSRPRPRSRRPRPACRSAGRLQSTTLVNRKARRSASGNAADELQPHQRMQLGVLVDRMIDPHQEALGLEVGEVLLQVEPRLAPESAFLRRCRDIVHPVSSASLPAPIQHGSPRPVTPHPTPSRWEREPRRAVIKARA